MARPGEPVLLQTVRGARGEVTCADAAGAWLAVGGGDRSVRSFRWTGGAEGAGWTPAGAAPRAHRYGVTAARWAAGGALLASGGVDGAVRVWSRRLAARGTLAAAGARAVRAVCWAGARLAAGHDDGALCVWLVPRALLLRRLQPHEGALHAVAAPAECALLLTACTEGVLKVFDFVELCTGEATPAPLLWVDGAHDLGALCADAAPGARHAATGGHDKRVRLWRARLGEDGRWSMQADGCAEGHGDTVTALRWSDAGEAGAAGAAWWALLASASLDRTARVWRVCADASDAGGASDAGRVPDAGGASRVTCLHVVPAHARYLTCVALSPDMRYMVTGSNDKSVRMWSLGDLTLDDVLQPPCHPLAHYGLGDLEGQEPNIDQVFVADEVPEEGESEGLEAGSEASSEEGGAQCVWRADLGAAINCIAVHGHLIATASSDGTVRTFRWEEGGARAGLCLPAHEYPARAVDVGAAGALLLSAGLDAAAHVWDVQMGVCLRTLAVPLAGGGGGEAEGSAAGEAGGGGVRGARVSPRRPALLLLVTDDGLAPLWSLADNDPNPIHVYGSSSEAATCCAWSGDARLLATGGRGGHLALHAPPPAARTLLLRPAHCGGVESCDFAAPGSVAGLPRAAHALASGGADGRVRLWLVRLDEDETEVRMTCAASVLAHGGCAACVRWGAAGLLASAGGDRWARVWRAEGGGGAGEGAALTAAGEAPAGGAGGAAAVALLTGPSGAAEGDGEGAGALLAVGALDGSLAVWRVGRGGARGAEGELPRFWDAAGAARWLREYVIEAPGMADIGEEARRALERRAAARRLGGGALLDWSPGRLLRALGLDDSEEDAAKAEDAGSTGSTRSTEITGSTDDAGSEGGEGSRGSPDHMDDAGDTGGGQVPLVGSARAALRARLLDELRWLRRAPPPACQAWRAPHALLCAVSHRVPRGAMCRAADGRSGARAALAELELATRARPAAGWAPPVAPPVPNYRLTAELRHYLAEHDR